MLEETMIDAARQYASQGLNVVPLIYKEKRPALEQLEPYFSQKTTDAELVQWFGNGTARNIGIVCGAISQLIVIDIDGEASKSVFIERLKQVPSLYEKVERTYAVASGNGMHFYLRIDPTDFPNGIESSVLHNGQGGEIRVKGNRGYVVAPPSLHPSGRRYKSNGKKEIQSINAEEWKRLLAAFHTTEAFKTPINDLFKNDYKKSAGNNRHEDILRVCDSLIARNADILSEKQIWEMAYVWNQKHCDPPLDDREFEKQWKQSAKFIARNRTKEEEEQGASNNTEVDNSSTTTVHELPTLTSIDDPKYAGKLIKVRAVVASNTVSYNVPIALKTNCSQAGKHKFPENIYVRLEPKQIARYPDSHAREKLSEEFARQPHTSKCSVTWMEETTTLYRVRVRPHVTSLLFKDGKQLDEAGIEYKPYDIFMTGEHFVLEPGATYEITGYVIPDPRSQKVTIFATAMDKDAGSEYDIENIKKLRAFLSDKPLQGRIGWVLDNFKKYSKVRKREDVIKVGFLSFFSPLSIEFDGKGDRGYLLGLIIGDSTTGKSETVKKWIRLLHGGQLVVAETSSIVGLTATTAQMANGGWSVEWGPLVLQDRRLIALDGAQRLSQGEWATLAESQRNGIIKIIKAARAEAYARTRQLLIANPVDFERRGTMTMDGFLYPYLALPSILDTINIARLDIAVFVGAGDVKIEDLNQVVDEHYDQQLHYLKDLRALVWEGKYKIEYSQDFVEAIHRRATELHNKYFVKTVPLTSVDCKFKLVRLSAALALGCCCFNESMDTVTVSKEHVEAVADLVDDIYFRAGFAAGARKEKEGEVNSEQVERIIEALTKIIQGGRQKNAAQRLLIWIANQSTPFAKEQLKNKFDLVEKNELRPLLDLLQEEQLIIRRSGFIPTTRGIQLARYLIEHDGGFQE